MQLSFELKTKEANPFSEENFLLLEENKLVFDYLKKFFLQKDYSKSQFTSLIIKGAQGSGKTHLLHIFAKKFQAEFLPKEEISDLNLSSFFEINQFYFVENIDKIKDEKTLLHLINSASEAGSFLILTTENSPKFQLKDLMSRLKNIMTVVIKNPGKEAIKQLLTHGLSRRQIKLPAKIIDFIASRVNKNYSAVSGAIKMIEFFCQESGKNFTMKEANKVIFATGAD